MNRSAEFNYDKTYRYKLGRELRPDGGKIVFCGVNPSDANAERDDRTVTRLIAFTDSLQYGELSVVNPFAAVNKDVAALADLRDPIGPENDYWLRREFNEADLIVPMWGAVEKVPPHMRYRFDVVRQMIRNTGYGCKVFGLTKHGHPKHPLYLAATTKLQEWTP